MSTAICRPSGFQSQIANCKSQIIRLAAVALAIVLAGCGTPSFVITPVQNTNVMQEIEVQPGKGGAKVAMIEVEGMLMNARSGGFLQPSENPLSLFTQQLEQAARDNSVKAVVLRVNSPGGTVTTSDAMFQLIERFRQQTHKPVLASWMGGHNVAAGEEILNAAGIPTFPYPDTAARVFGQMWRYAENLCALYETPVPSADPHDPRVPRVRRARRARAAGDPVCVR